MKIIVLIIFLCVTASVYAEPSAPSIKQIIDWAGFSKPVHLKAKKVDHGYFVTIGDSVWIYSYSAEKETLYNYLIGLYKAGTLFGKNRTEVENNIEELSEKDAGQHSEELKKHIRVETRPDGRKVYFTMMGFGPGGAGFAGFAKVGDYDLLLYQIVDFEDDMQPEQKLKDPAEPKSELPDIFVQLEKYIKKAKISR